MTRPAIVWLRRDLRLSDQGAFAAACAAGPVVPVYVLDDEGAAHRRMGGASRWWLHHSLAALDASLRSKGSRLILRRGKSAAVLAQIADEAGAGSVHALHHYEPWWRNAERAVAKRLTLYLHHGNYLVPPGTIRNGSGNPYRIYTPFWRALQQHLPPPRPQPEPAKWLAPGVWPSSDNLEDWGLRPVRPDWASGIRAEWAPGEAGAIERVEAFTEHAEFYVQERNFPDLESTSRLSPHLHFGEVTPATVWHSVAGRGSSVQKFRGELGWRDYAQNVIQQFPDYGLRNAVSKFDRLPWRSSEAADADLKAWQQGRTGYPIVDAGMRQLWHSGWMHNRVRMIVASFLTKHLLIDWRQGERWFWDTLIDADYAQNTVNWQWSAGSGVDANMFVRIMAPLSQSEKFAAAGYIRRWVPELAHLSDRDIHDPPHPVEGYPAKLIGHAEGRARALAAWQLLQD